MGLFVPFPAAEGGGDCRSYQETERMADQEQGLYDDQYRRFRENQDSHKGYEFQQAPTGNIPPPVLTFSEKLKWWALRGWRRKKILAERDRFQQEILNIKASRPRS
jgi:hypothetical protein